MTEAIRLQKFGSTTSRVADGLQPCLKILRNIMGTPLIKLAQGDLSALRGLFWVHSQLCLTTVYFPSVRTFLSAPGSRETGILILRAMSCPISVEQGDTSIDLSRGEVIFMPSDAPLLITLPGGGRLDCAYLPRKALVPTVPDPSRLFWRPMPSTYLPLQLLVTYAGYLLQNDHQTERDTTTIVNHFYQLLPILIENLEVGNKQSSLIQRMDIIKEKIEGQISNSDFSLTGLAESEGITPRAIQKLFKRENTTFSRYLLKRRLDVARAAILRGEPTGIAQIAYDCGFEDPAYFSRVFRSHFGFTPSVLRQQVSQFYKASI